MDTGSLLISLFSAPDRKETWDLPSLENLTYLVVNECVCSSYPFSRKIGWALYMADAVLCFFRWLVFISCCTMIWKHTQCGVKNDWEPEECCIARLIVVRIVCSKAQPRSKIMYICKDPCMWMYFFSFGVYKVPVPWKDNSDQCCKVLFVCFSHALFSEH